MLKRLILAASVAATGAVGAQTPTNDQEPPRSMAQAPAWSFVGDRYRIGLGLDSEFDVVGEFLATLRETSSSTWLAEGWLGKGGAAGLKLNYHWLVGARSEQGPDGPVYVDGSIAKLFLATDQNAFDDRKLSVGFGWEREDFFAGAYGMRALSSARLVNRAIDLRQFAVTGRIDGRDFTRMDTLQQITETFEKPYDWGLGLRAGQYFDSRLLRLNGGLDYERGDFGNAQFTASLSLDRFFANTPHGISLRTGWARKRGDLVDERNDWRASVVYNYSFGGHYRPIREFREQAVEVMPEERFEDRVIATEITLSDRATFDFDRSELRPEAQATLREVLGAIHEGGLVGQVRVLGHTCNIGSARYNQGLSERRARAVVDFFLANGLEADAIEWAGRGLHEPRFPNDSRENRARNRRVEITFVTRESRTERIRVSPEGPITELRMVEVPTEAAWIRRALRNPVQHKRQVDTYRFEAVSRSVSEGEVVLANRAPIANANAFTVEADSTDNTLDVLANDTDPDGDPLTLIGVTAPANGTAAISGNLLLYTPVAGFVGVDSFTYTISDSFGAQATATVSVTVVRPNRPPVANDVNASTIRTQAIDIDVLANDSDPDGDALEIIAFTQPANGSVSRVGSLLRYQPDPLFFGQDLFTYRVSDGQGGEATATVLVEVIFANRAPVANPDEAAGPAGVPILVDVLANDFDPDGDPLELVSVVRVTPAPASAVINEDGTISFTISANCSGYNLFRYTVRDPFGATAQANVTIQRQASGEGTEADPDCFF